MLTQWLNNTDGQAAAQRERLRLAAEQLIKLNYYCAPSSSSACWYVCEI